ncbi:MAG: phenylalanine--tRNA ligase subunit alpha [Deltaproteobacteria bacterium]|nr:phenylalanine--tRNA ligase subunit alpha [Deltaproteobacteria bacterium]
MQDFSRLDDLVQQALGIIEKAGSENELKELKVTYLGKKGKVTSYFKALGSAPAQERKALGQQVNRARQAIENALAVREEAIKLDALDQKLEARKVDVTLPGRPFGRGTVHILDQVMDRILDLFSGLGFDVVLGPEVETSWNNFDALNFPPDHPARDMQDTVFIEDEIVLRTHTSPVQVRTMKSRKPPLRVVCPGVVYRRDTPDATHAPAFFQVEGLMVGEHVSFAELKGTLNLFARKLFGEGDTRFRPSFFPFTEPSAEMDVRCFACGGEGCALCKQSGWIEILGCGMVDPAVFDAVGYDNEKYTGWAFGMGVERIAMLRHAIDDIRLFAENDLRFLKQFV